MAYRIVHLAPAFVLAACTTQAQVPAPRPPTIPTAESSAFSKAPRPLPGRVGTTARDAEALLVASAMSFLGKIVAEYDGMSMVLVEHDPAELLDEAFADRSFCELVAAADVGPHDGVLTPCEAQHLESSVLASL